MCCPVTHDAISNTYIFEPYRYWETHRFTVELLNKIILNNFKTVNTKDPFYSIHLSFYLNEKLTEKILLSRVKRKSEVDNEATDFKIQKCKRLRL